MAIENVKVVSVHSAEKRTIRIPDFVPEDHMFVYFTGRTLSDLIVAALRWAAGGRNG